MVFGQDSMNYLDAKGIEYNIVKTYPNGVRIGNLPNHKNPNKKPDKHDGIGQAWFPSNWSASDIRSAAEYVQNNTITVPDFSHGPYFANFRGVRVGIMRNPSTGEVSTIFPDNRNQPGM